MSTAHTRFAVLLDGLIRNPPGGRVLVARQPIGRFAPGTAHSQTRLLVCLEGSRIHRWLHDGVLRSSTLVAGDSLLSAPHSLDYTAYFEANRTLGVIYYADRTRFVEVLGEPPAGQLIVAGRPVLTYEAPTPLNERGRAVVAALLAMSPPAGDWIEAHLLHVLLAMTRQLLGSENDSQGAVAEASIWPRLVAYLGEHFAEPIGRKSVADAFGIHPNHLSRLFAQHRAGTFHATLLEHRLLHAANLLEHTVLPVGDIARLSGFANVTPFNRAFRLRYGCSPSMLRRRRRAVRS